MKGQRRYEGRGVKYRLSCGRTKSVLATIVMLNRGSTSLARIDLKLGSGKATTIRRAYH